MTSTKQRATLGRSTRVMIGALITVSTLVAAAFPSVAQSGEKTKATEIGVSASTIRVAVVADVDNALAPGAFQASVDGVRGWAKYTNQHGGLAGRKVVVDFIDSRLSADEARNAVIKACSEDFALVGTSALFLNNVDDMVQCADLQGAPTGIPDLAVLTTEISQMCSPVTFPVLPPTLDCSTKDDSPQTYLAPSGQTKYYLNKLGLDLHGIWLNPSDLKSVANADQVGIDAQQKLGVKPDGQGVYPLSARTPQSGYTPAVQVIRDADSTFARSGLDFTSTISLRKEAKLQNVTSVKVWDCQQNCYDQKFLQDGGADVDGQYSAIPFLPTEDGKANDTLVAYRDSVGAGNASSFAAQAFASGLLLSDAIETVVAKDGVNGITRSAVLDAVRANHDFTAGGLLGHVDVGAKRASPCFVLLQVKNSKFVRVWPKKAGTLDCTKSNVVKLKLDLL